MKHICILIVTLSSIFSMSAQNTWQDYTKQADSLQLLFEYKSAFNLRLKAIELAAVSQKDTVPFLKLLRDISKSEFNIEANINKDEAYISLQGKVIQLETFKTSPKRLYETYLSMYNIANKSMRNLQDADVYISKSLDYHYKSQEIDSLVLLKTLHKSGVTSREMGRLDMAINRFKDAVNLYSQLKIKNNALLGKIYLDFAQIYSARFLNNSQYYIKYLRKSEVLFDNAENLDINYLTNFYTSLSSYETGQGNFIESERYLKKSFQLYKDYLIKAENLGLDKRDITKEIELHAYLIEIYWLTSNEKLMLHHLNCIVQLSEFKELNEIEKDLASLGHLFVAKYYRYEDSSKALLYLDKGFEFFPANDFGNLKEDFNLEKAKIFNGQEELNDALSILDDLNKKSDLPWFMYKNVLEQNILIHLKLGNYDRAYSFVNEALESFSEENKGLDIRTLTYEDFVPSTVLRDANHLIFFAEGFQKTAEKDEEVIEALYWMALKQFQSNFNQEILNDRIAGMYSKICNYFYIKASKGNLDTLEQNEFIEFTEAIESKYLLNTFLKNRMDSNQTELDNAISEEQFIRSKITYLKRKNVSRKSDSINQLIFDENIKLEKIDNQLRSSRNKILNLINAKSPLDHLSDKYIIKYRVINSTMFRIVLDRGDIKIDEIKDYEIVRSKINETLTQLKDLNIDAKIIKQNTSYLYSKLLTDLDLARTIYIIPDDILYYLPFELLVYDNQFLLETNTISYTSSFSFLANNLSKLDYKKDIALFAPSYKQFAPSKNQLAVRGDPYYLEGTLKEVNSISQLFSNSDLFINDDASKAAFTGLYNNYSILHLSMHSFVNDQDSELSSLVFSDNDIDYELYISELYGLNLNADMAVLSACNTGVGELKTGQGVVSMNTAFTAAGVPSVLSSLWSAPDEATQNIMTSFYKHLKKGDLKSNAIRKAKLDYLESVDDPNLTHPYYWAGFVLTGDTSAIVSPTNYWLYGLVFFALILIVFMIAKRRLIPKS
ncbi:CHAT domain-containing protein [Winogradskyella sp. Asnod2-B02-A]|uniref:CHAT domain-containing protein n=1 Tax=Winogradskyella sp. Asnod2-B02-A TaxID=3160583 RepID=UPI00386B659E